MFGTSLILSWAIAIQSTATFEKSRADYLKCLRGYLYESVVAKMTDTEFNMAIAGTCSAEQAAFHAAVIALDRADGIKPADAKENADLQVEDYLENFKAKFADYMESGTVPAKD